MPRGIPNNRAQSAPVLGAPSAPTKAPKARGLEARLSPTNLHHIYHFDVEGDGRFREVAVVKMIKAADGTVQSVYYIDTQLLDNIDKGRIKQAVTNVHADKYQLWDLLSQVRLNNGVNGLDYFHQLTKVKHGPGATNTQLGGGLAGATVEGTQMVGAEFTDPASASINSESAL